MKSNIFLGLLLLAIPAAHLYSQTGAPQKPVKTGNEWKMPSDVFKRSRAFSEKLQRVLGLDSVQTKKVFDAFLANTKPLDEISVLPISDKEKQAAIKSNKLAFNDTLKHIFTEVQYKKYLKLSGL